jgi:hypothetical protein
MKHALELRASIKVYQATLQSEHCRLRTIASSHLFQYSAYMNADRLLRDSQFLGDLTIAASFRNARKHLLLTRCQLHCGHTLGQPT